MSIKRGKIGEFAKRVKVGFVGTCEKYYTEDKRYPMIRTTNLTETGIDYSDLKYVTEEFYDKNKKSQLHDGDVLIARFGTSGTACVYHGGDAQCLNAIIVEPDMETTIPEYLAIVVNSRSVRDEVNKRIVGSTQAILNTKVLSDIEISLPSLEEQRKVVEIFQSLQKICIRRNEELLTLDELIKARFVELFGDPISNPKGWNKEELSAHIDLLSGYPFKSEQYVDEGINICGGLIIMPQRIDWDCCVHWPSVEGYEDYLLKENDIVMALDRPWISEGFKVSLVDGNHLPALLIQRTARIRATDVNQMYLYYCFVGGGFDKHSNVTGSLVPHISAKDIRSFEIMMPPMKLQNEFAEFVNQVDKSKIVVQKALDETRLLFDSLMQEFLG